VAARAHHILKSGIQTVGHTVGHTVGLIDPPPPYEENRNVRWEFGHTHRQVPWSQGFYIIIIGDKGTCWLAGICPTVISWPLTAGTMAIMIGVDRALFRCQENTWTTRKRHRPVTNVILQCELCFGQCVLLTGSFHTCFFRNVTLSRH
jgi:hypothetical protein